MPEIKLVGTSHIAKESIEKVRRVIASSKPDIVAIELDRKRFLALGQKQQRFSLYSIGRVGLKGFIFALIGSWASKKLGRIVGVEPGDEMRAAVASAKQAGSKIALIDQDIELTLQRFSQTLTWKERLQIAKDIVRTIVFRKKEMQRLGIDKLDLTKVPPDQLIEKLMGMMRTNYPNIYNVLVEERNKVMAKRLQALASKYDSIVAVVGAGHISGMKALLSAPAKEAIVREKKAPDS